MVSISPCMSHSFPLNNSKWIGDVTSQGERVLGSGFSALWITGIPSEFGSMSFIRNKRHQTRHPVQKETAGGSSELVLRLSRW